MSLHFDLHTPQLTGHLRLAKSGFLVHSPKCAQPAHSGTLSLHSGVQMLQLVGQCRSMKSALSSHSPARAHATHVAFASAQRCSQMPHDSGHSRFMTATASAHESCGTGGGQGGTIGSSAFERGSRAHTQGCWRSGSPSPTARNRTACRCTWIVRTAPARPRRPQKTATALRLWLGLKRRR